jgi:hypothetical protein
MTSEAQSAIEKLRERIELAEEVRIRLLSQRLPVKDAQVILAHIDKQTTEIERLRGALKWFAPHVDWMPHPYCVEGRNIIEASLGDTK